MRKFRNRLKALAFLLFFQPFVILFSLCQKMAIDRPMGSTGLGIVRHFSTLPLHAAGQDDLLKPLLGDAGRKVKMLLEKIAYLLSWCYNSHKTYPLVLCGWSCFHYNTHGLCFPFRHFSDLLIYSF